MLQFTFNTFILKPLINIPIVLLMFKEMNLLILVGKVVLAASGHDGTF